MNNEKEISVPLFLHLEGSGSPVTYIVNDKFIRFEENLPDGNCPFKSWNLLHSIYLQLDSINFIPLELESFFIDKTPIKLGIMADYIIGTFDHFRPRNRSLDAEIAVDRKNEEVTFSEFKLYQSEDEIFTFDYSTTISLSDAFYNLSNICVNGRSIFLNYIDKIDLETFTDDIRAHQNFGYGSENSALENCERYLLAYLDYIHMLLKQDLISPEKILFNSGAQTLAFFTDLPVVTNYIRKILDNNYWVRSIKEPISAVYYTFLETIILTDIEDEVRDFLSLHSDFFTILKTRSF